jgi:tetratricopeptide (TPR) repeat protein
MLTLAPLLPVHGVNAARVAAHSERWLEAHKSDPFGYIPAVYTPRPEIEAALDAFLLGDRSGFLLLGEAGIGKSSVLCRMVERWRERGEAVFAFDGRTLSGDEDIEEQARKAADFDGTVETFIAQIRNQSGRMVLVVDGVDRSTHPTVLLQRLCGVIRNRAPATGDDRPTAVRVVISFRRTLFELALKDIGIVRDDQHVFARDAFQTRPVERQGRTEQTVENVLERVGENQELEAMYERYRAFEGGSRFCPRTTFQSLGPAARKALSQPLFLRLAMETYHGQHIPGDERDEEGAREPLWTGRILEDFSTLKLDRVASGRGLVEELVTTLRKQQATGMFVADLPEVSRRWQQAFIAGAGGRSAYRALRDEGILVETEREVMDNGRLRRREWVSFTSDQLFEYLLAADVLAQYAGEPDAVALASVLEESQEFRSMAGAAAHLLTRAAQSGRPELLAETLDADTSGADLPVLVRVLTTLEGMGSADFEPSVNAIAGAVHRPWACRVLLAAAGEFAERRRPRPMLHCSQWAVARARKLVNDSAEVELLELATALHSQGYALIELGQLPEALGAYDEAIGLYRQLVDGEGRRELRNDLAGVLVNKAILIEGPEFRNWDEALGLYQDAIVLREGCVADGMTHLLADLLRTIRYRVMTLLDLGRWVDTADDVVRVLDHTQTAGQSGELSEAAAGEASALLALLAGLPASHRDAVYAALGEWEQIVRVIVDGGDGGAEGE